MPTFLIDARFLLRNTSETFWGTPLFVVNGSDNTFCYGFMRDLLRLRNSLHINAGAIALSRDAWSLAPEKDVRTVLEFCRDIGVIVIEGSGALAIVATFAERFSDIVTDDQRLLYFCTAKRTIHLAQQSSSTEPITPEEVHRRMGVPAQCVPTYLALTEAGKYGQATNGSKPTLTAREARRFVETHGTLRVIYQHLSAVKSSILRKRLTDNQKIFDQRYQDNTVTPSMPPACLPTVLEWKLHTEKVESLFRKRGFYSLVRMLPLPTTPAQPLGPTTRRLRASKSYTAILTCQALNTLLDRIAQSRVCAIDTEADDKDPRTATLFGVAFALVPGEAFFVPFSEGDMGDLAPKVVRRGLQKLFTQTTMFVGHNLKYDLTLLYRNAIEPPVATFDTLLAAHECYGDLDFFNLPYLAERFLGRKIASYKDIVAKGKTLLELPFEEMKDHACADADTALRLYRFLQKELTGRNIDRQFEERTMPLERVLLRMEKEGLPVDRKPLEQLRFQLVDRMHEAEKRVFDIIGSAANLESHEEMSSLIREKLGLRGVHVRKPLTQSFLEQLASHRPVVKLVVKYRRIGKQLRRLDSIIKAIRRGRVYPLLSQTRDGHGRISSADPDLFADDGLEELRDCVGGVSVAWFRDKGRSLDLAQEASGDRVLKKDRFGPKHVNLFMSRQAIMKGVDHDELLLRVLIGEHPHRLSTRFLMDRLTVSSIVHALASRYPKLFQYVDNAKAQGLKKGYVEREGIRRYFYGFGSSSLEKRNKAQLLACRWLLQY
jgi:DNA polymerase I-like protein with 3'-5' exonuclease and polymerase domains